jgi:hypothetical protein
MRIKKKRVTWSASPSPDIAGYKLYWSKEGHADYHSEHAQLGDVTHVVLPDDIASFPVTEDRIELGITAVGLQGNESEMVKIMVRFDFAPVEGNIPLTRLRPGMDGWEPPVNASIFIDGLNYCVIENALSNGSLSHHTRYYYFESHYVEEWPSKNRNPRELEKARGQVKR